MWYIESRRFWVLGDPVGIQRYEEAFSHFVYFKYRVQGVAKSSPRSYLWW